MQVDKEMIDFYEQYLYIKKGLNKINNFSVDEERFNTLEELKANGTPRLFVGSSIYFDDSIDATIFLERFYRLIQSRLHYKLRFDNIKTEKDLTKAAVSLEHPTLPYRIDFHLSGKKFNMYFIKEKGVDNDDDN